MPSFLAASATSSQQSWAADPRPVNPDYHSPPPLSAPARIRGTYLPKVGGGGSPDAMQGERPDALNATPAL
eukprot:6214678-Pleurochrysis_carterae.AAC.3